MLQTVRAEGPRGHLVGGAPQVAQHPEMLKATHGKSPRTISACWWQQIRLGVNMPTDSLVHLRVRKGRELPRSHLRAMVVSGHQWENLWLDGVEAGFQPVLHQ